MDLFGHLILDSQIIGIGPVFQEQYPDNLVFNQHGTCRYQFELHLAGHTTTIFSPWFYAKTDKRQAELMRRWKTDYFQHRKAIADLLAASLSIPTHKISAQ